MHTRILLLFFCILLPYGVVNAQWVQVNAPLGSDNSIRFATIDTFLFALTNANGIFRTSDNGLTWNSLNTGLANSDILSIANSSTDLFIGTMKGVFSSTDHGLSWNAKNQGIDKFHIYTLNVNDSNIFAGTDHNGVFNSKDSGASWAPKGLSQQNIDYIVASGQSLYAGTYFVFFFLKMTTVYG